MLRRPQYPDNADRRVVERLRVTMLQAAADANVNVVSTLVYACGVDDDHLTMLVRASTEAGAEVSLVQLAPSIGTLHDRLGGPSRIGTNKITDSATLTRMMQRYDLLTKYGADDLVVDNSNLAVDDVVELIASHVGLPRTAAVR